MGRGTRSWRPLLLARSPNAVIRTITVDSGQGRALGERAGHGEHGAVPSVVPADRIRLVSSRGVGVEAQRALALFLRIVSGWFRAAGRRGRADGSRKHTCTWAVFPC